MPIKECSVRQLDAAIGQNAMLLYSPPLANQDDHSHAGSLAHY